MEVFSSMQVHILFLLNPGNRSWHAGMSKEVVDRGMAMSILVYCLRGHIVICLWIQLSEQGLQTSPLLYLLFVNKLLKCTCLYRDPIMCNLYQWNLGSEKIFYNFHFSEDILLQNQDGSIIIQWSYLYKNRHMACKAVCGKDRLNSAYYIEHEISPQAFVFDHLVASSDTIQEDLGTFRKYRLTKASRQQEGKISL